MWMVLLKDFFFEVAAKQYERFFFLPRVGGGGGFLPKVYTQPLFCPIMQSDKDLMWNVICHVFQVPFEEDRTDWWKKSGVAPRNISFHSQITWTERKWFMSQSHLHWNLAVCRNWANLFLLFDGYLEVWLYLTWWKELYAIGREVLTKSLILHRPLAFSYFICCLSHHGGCCRQQINLTDLDVGLLYTIPGYSLLLFNFL